MINAQYNILGWYDSLEARQWNRTIEEGGNEELFRIFLETNSIPATQLIVDDATTANLYLLDSSDEVVGSAIAMTVESYSDSYVSYKRLIYLGTTLSGNDDGDYSLKIVNGSNTYYSDVFGWTSNSDYLNDLLKISATSNDIRLGDRYVLNMDSFTLECYINADSLVVEPSVEEVAEKKYSVNSVVYGDLSFTRSFNVYGCEYIFRFLLGLRLIECNGTVTVTNQFRSYTANDIMAEISDDHFSDTMQIKFSFVDLNETIGVYNSV
jgi:hypothetical protein